MRPMNILMIAGLACMALASLVMALGVFYAIAMRGKIAKAPTWPRATATVTVSRVKMFRRLAMAEIEYRYRAGGEMRRCRNYQLTPLKNTLEEAHGLVEAYPVGREVEVYYDPTMPGLATIELGGDANAYLRHFGRTAWRLALFGAPLLVASRFL